MSQPDIIRGTYFILALGDGQPAETFDPLCGLTTRELAYQANTNSSFIRDCEDPEDIPVQRIIVTGEAWTLTGSGDMNRADIAKLDAAKGRTRNYRFYYTEPADDEVFRGYWEGPGVMTNKTITGSDESYAQISLTIASDGEWTFTPTAGS